MSARDVTRRFRLETDSRLSTMEFLYGCSQQYRYFDFSLIESIYFNTYVRYLFQYDNIHELYMRPSMLLMHSNPVPKEAIEQQLIKHKDKVLAFERDSKLIPLLKQALARLELVSSMKFGAVIDLTDEEWRRGFHKDQGFCQAREIFRDSFIKDSSVEEHPDWFGCREYGKQFSTGLYIPRWIKIHNFISENRNLTFEQLLEQIKDCVKCKANFHDCKDIKYELSTLEKELLEFEEAIAEQETILLNEVEKAKRKDRHFGITIVISIFAAVMWQSMNHWWLGVVTFPMIGYLCFVCSLLKEKKNLVWKNCLSLHKKFCDTLKSYITKHKIL